MKLTVKQRLFADEYIKSGNATQAAIKAGYANGVSGRENLQKPTIKSYIDAKMAEIESHKIADAKEVLEFYTRVLRKEETEEVALSTGAEVVTVEKKPSFKDQITAAKELLKRYPLNDPLVAAQLKKLQAEADTAIWKRDELTGKNDTGDKTTLIDDIGGDDNGGD